MSDKVKLKIIGISQSQIKTGAYALILAEQNGPYHIPIVIGASEAQSIAIIMENIRLPRPLTHDLTVSITNAFGIMLEKVFIYKFEDGIFSSELTFKDDDRQIIIDSRTSDAIALALRTKAPIYTTQDIINETGFKLQITDNQSYKIDQIDQNISNKIKLENLAIEELERILNKHIELEEYEEAAKINKIINSKKNNN
jgi:bifunctional DNase/RNase